MVGMWHTRFSSLQAESRDEQEYTRTRYSQQHTLHGLLPLATTYTLRFPGPPQIIQPCGSQVLNTWALGGIFPLLVNSCCCDKVLDKITLWKNEFIWLTTWGYDPSWLGKQWLKDSCLDSVHGQEAESKGCHCSAHFLSGTPSSPWYRAIQMQDVSSLNLYGNTLTDNPRAMSPRRL